MKHITKLMVNEFNIKRLGYDFMGYQLQKGDMYTAHHLIIPARFGGKLEKWNTAVLCGNSSHPYLHLIESKDEEIFYHITSEMVDMNILGRLDVDNLRKIDDLLRYFEKEHCSDRTKKGKLLVKDEYLRRFAF